MKRPFELAATVKWAYADGHPEHTCEGAITYSEIAPAPTGAAKGFACEQSESLVKAPPAALMPMVKEARAALQTRLDAAMQGFVDALAAK